ncbi:MAG: SMI1/KNR4 family protein [Saprospiraceae bacterium]
MNEIERLKLFFRMLELFLVDNGIEEIVEGYSEEEIITVEKQYNCQLPLAYRLFLKTMAKQDLSVFDSLDFQLDGIDYARETAKELTTDLGFEVEKDAFIFTEWQGYRFIYFILDGNENPITKKCQECSSTNIPPEIIYEGLFTDWLCRRIRISIEILYRLRKISNKKQNLEQLEMIRIIPLQK